MIPTHLQKIHQNTTHLRHARYAHHGEHETVEKGLKIEYNGSSIVVDPTIEFNFLCDTPKEWDDLFQWIDEHMYNCVHEILKLLTEQTGIKWEIPHGPPPDWVR